jgi:hypothetical protein
MPSKCRESNAQFGSGWSTSLRSRSGRGCAAAVGSDDGPANYWLPAPRVLRPLMTIQAAFERTQLFALIAGKLWPDLAKKPEEDYLARLAKRPASSREERIFSYAMVGLVCWMVLLVYLEIYKRQRGWR